MEYNFVKSPLNYTGGKYKLLESLFSFFPKEINNFVDLFAGGFNVGINVKAKTIYCNDQITYLIEMYDFFLKTDINELLTLINKRITEYELDQYNVQGYNKLRDDYNQNQNPLDLFVLTCFSFNHQIRFNNSMKFNTPFGKERSSFNESIKKNLIAFCNKLQSNNCVLSNKDFRNFDYGFLGAGDVVYCDPPYLITNGSYNDGKRGFGDWKQEEDDALFELLDKLNDKGVVFFLSNVFYHKGLANERLIRWSQKYTIIYLDKNYSNCSYHLKDRNTNTVEVLVTNMEVANEK